VLAMDREVALSEIWHVRERLDKLEEVVKSIGNEEFEFGDIWRACVGMGWGEYECVELLREAALTLMVFGKGTLVFENRYDYIEFHELSRAVKEFFGVDVDPDGIYRRWVTKAMEEVYAWIFAVMYEKVGGDPVGFLDKCVMWFDEHACINIFEHMIEKKREGQ